MPARRTSSPFGCCIRHPPGHKQAGVTPSKTEGEKNPHLSGVVVSGRQSSSYALAAEHKPVSTKRQAGEVLVKVRNLLSRLILCRIRPRC